MALAFYRLQLSRSVQHLIRDEPNHVVLLFWQVAALPESILLDMNSPVFLRYSEQRISCLFSVEHLYKQYKKREEIHLAEPFLQQSRQVNIRDL